MSSLLSPGEPLAAYAGALADRVRVGDFGLETYDQVATMETYIAAGQFQRALEGRLADDLDVLLHGPDGCCYSVAEIVSDARKTRDGREMLARLVEQLRLLRAYLFERRRRAQREFTRMNRWLTEISRRRLPDLGTIVPRMRRRSSSRQVRPARRTRRATARSPSRLGDDDPEPEPLAPLTAEQRRWLKSEVDRRRRKQLKRESKYDRLLLAEEPV